MQTITERLMRWLDEGCEPRKLRHAHLRSPRMPAVHAQVVKGLIEDERVRAIDNAIAYFMQHGRTISQSPDRVRLRKMIAPTLGWL